MTASGGMMISVAVPVSLDRPFTYRLPPSLGEALAPGTRVLVPLGPRALIGVVRPEEDPVAPDPSKVKDIYGVLDPEGPCLPPDVVALCEWMAGYYVAPIGEVYRLALPGMLTSADARRAVVTEAGLAAWRGIEAPLLGTPPPPMSNAATRLLEALVQAGGEGLPVAKLPAIRPRIAGSLLRLTELEADSRPLPQFCAEQPEARRWAVEAAGVTCRLAFAAGLHHRDLHPDNILCTRRGDLVRAALAA